eukprot:252748-Amorphochlora_amoeboformis.AAC.1
MDRLYVVCSCSSVVFCTGFMVRNLRVHARKLAKLLELIAHIYNHELIKVSSQPQDLASIIGYHGQIAMPAR